MKTKLSAYIFYIIVIVLIIASVYILYKEQNNIVGVDVLGDPEKKENTIKTEINIGITGFDTINPILSKHKDVQYIDKLIYDSLLNITKDFRIENNLTEEWTKLDSRTYLIKLKKDIYWHNNTILTANDIKFTIDNLKKVDSIYKANVQEISEVQVIDENTLKIYLLKEVPFFEYMLSFPIVSMEGYEENTLNFKTKIPMGTGEYKISSIGNSEIILERKREENEYQIKRINIKLFSDWAELYNNLMRENIDIINTSNIEYEDYIGKIGFNVNTSPDREFDYLLINSNNKILSDPIVRQAINYVIDKTQIVANSYGNKYLPSNFPLDYGHYLYNIGTDDEQTSVGAAAHSRPNINKAKQILQENGWIYESNKWRKTGITSRLELTLTVNNTDVNRILVAENIKDQLEQIGIHINIIKASDWSFKNYIKNKNYQLLLTGDTVSISPDLNKYFGENNNSNYYNEEMITLLKEVNNIENTEILKEKYNKIIEIYEQDMPFISLYSNCNITIANSELRGNLDHNWYNIFYDMKGWYKSK